MGVEQEYVGRIRKHCFAGEARYAQVDTKKSESGSDKEVIHMRYYVITVVQHKVRDILTRNGHFAQMRRPNGR